MFIRQFLFIDGSNLYNAQFELFGPSKYMHFGRFIEQSAPKNRSDIYNEYITLDVGELLFDI